MTLLQSQPAQSSGNKKIQLSTRIQHKDRQQGGLFCHLFYFLLLFYYLFFVYFCFYFVTYFAICISIFYFIIDFIVLLVLLYICRLSNQSAKLYEHSTLCTCCDMAPLICLLWGVWSHICLGSSFRWCWCMSRRA